MRRALLSGSSFPATARDFKEETLMKSSCSEYQKDDECALNGGLEEMVEELNSGKVMYAFCRVKDPNSGLPKYVLVNWTGEGVNDVRKGACANHVSTVAGFLKGAHVTINARAEEDVEPELIMEKVAKASGANYSFHKESGRFQDAGPQAPVGSVYQKTNAMSEIKRVNKDNFWAKAEVRAVQPGRSLLAEAKLRGWGLWSRPERVSRQKDEENRRLEEKRRAEEERQRLERERRERELQEAAGREQRYKARSNEIEAQKRLQQEAERRDREQQQQRKEQAEEQEAEQRRGFRRSESVEKAQEAASLIAQRAVNPRDIFKQKERSAPGDTAAAAQPGKLRSPFLQREANAVPSPGPPARETPPASPVPAAGYNSSAPEPPADEANVYEEPPDASAIYEEPPQDHADGAKYDYSAEYQQTPDLAGKGLCARALYDYQAADDTEISFDPENIITNIEMIDEGWWRGYGPDGHFGMFPANYVELIE
ncbi:Drebrin-like protein [Aix galericulata]|nr:Drebrin-like protein [Aix galericulata]